MNGLSDQFRQFHSVVKKTATRTVRMTWRGSKIPRGATVGGVKIAWTQNGVVTGEGCVYLGLYDHIREFSGSGGNEHEVLLYVDDEVMPPEGGTAEIVEK